MLAGSRDIKEWARFQHERFTPQNWHLAVECDAMRTLVAAFFLLTFLLPAFGQEAGTSIDRLVFTNTSES